MSSADVEKVVGQVKALSADEQRQVRSVLDALLGSSAARCTEDDFRRGLLEAGLLMEDQQPSIDEEAYRRYRPVEVRGKPVSETLVEERR